MLPIRGLSNLTRALPDPTAAARRAVGLPEPVDAAVAELRDSRRSKEQRIISRSLLQANGQLWLREALPEEDGEAVRELGGRRVYRPFLDFYQQATEYPRSAHDDLLDALDNALQCAEKHGTAWGEAFIA